MKEEIRRRTTFRPLVGKFVLLVFLALFMWIPVTARAAQILRNQIPPTVAALTPAGDLSASTRLDLAIGLPLRNQNGLSALLKQLYDPASTNYHRYLTPEAFAQQFGPAQEDYQALIDFAKGHHLVVSATHPNRMLLDVRGSVADIEGTFHVKMRVYQHPTESRTFYAPDVDPSIDLAVPILGISGLNNFALPRPRLKASLIANANDVRPNAGSGPSGTYLGKDFRSAYVANSALDGSGQTVGLLEFDGYTSSDIAYYVTKAGLPSVPLQNVLLDGFGGQPTGDGGEVEVSLDIEVAISMAPALSEVIVYEAGPYGSWHDMLNRMATDNLAKQLSCSWYIPGGGPDPVADQIWQQMAAQGQSFLNASGDSDAYTGQISFPGDSPYITQVGGTTLTTSGPGGSWVSEKVWNWGGGIGSSGGASTSYAIPSWQAGLNMTANLGSTTMRNTPDVALTADNVYVRADGADYDVGGTSCSAPLWAAFVALANQQATSSGAPTLGFLNQLIYSIGTGPSYGSVFHDITTGNNQRAGSGAKFPAVPGYDLCTGWGTPPGQSLIDALAGPPVPTPPHVTTQPQSLTVTSGYPAFFYVTVYGSYPLSYQWSLKGTNIPNATNSVFTLNDAEPLTAGAYSVTVTNLYGSTVSSNAVLTVLTVPPAILQQPTNVAAYVTFDATFTVAASGSLPLSYQWSFDGTNIAGATDATLTLANVQFSQAGNFAVLVSNLYGGVLSSNATLTVNPIPPCDPVPTGLVSWWAAEGNANDNEGTNNGILENGTGFGPGEVHHCFILDGVSNFVLVNASPSLDVGSGSGMTIEGWINPTSIDNYLPLAEYERVLGSGSASDVGVVFWASYYSGPGSLYGNMVDTTGAVHEFASAPGLLVAGAWQHVAMSYDKPSGVASLYLNGQVVTQTNLGSFTPQTSFNLVLGARTTFGSVTSPANAFPGGMDEMSLYARALSAYEVQGIVAAGPGGKCPPPPTISVQPQSLTVTSGYPASFSVSASGAYPLSYQWSFDGTNVLGATNSVFTLNDAEPLNAGTYSVTVTNYYGSAVSSNAVLTVLTTPPVILQQPTNAAVFVGFHASFSVAASGSLPLNYQWSFDGTNVADATNTTLTLNNVQLGQAGTYAVLVSNPFGSTLSSNATLTVVPPSSGCDPVPAGLVSWWAAEGNANDSEGTNNGILENGTGFESGEVNQAFSLNGVNNFVLVNASPSLDVGSGSGMTIEGWINPSSIDNYLPLAEYERVLDGGSSDVGVVFWASYYSGPGSLYGNLTDTTGTVHEFASAGGLLVAGAWQHVALTYDQASGVGSLYLNGQQVAQSNLGSFTPQTSFNLVLGARTAFGTVSNLANAFAGGMDEMSLYARALSAYEIQAIFNAGSAGKCSSPAPPVILEQPTNQIVAIGNNAAFGVTVGGSLPLSYQWSFNGTNIARATNATLTLTNVQLSQAGNYAVLLTNRFGSALSSNATLSVIPPSSGCDPAPAGLVSWWAAEGNANDSEGTNNGTLENGTGFESGEVHQAFSLNGVNNFVVVNASPSLNVGAGSGMTIEGWINPNSIANYLPLAEYERVLGGGSSDVGVVFWASYYNGPGALYGNITDTTGAVHEFASGGGLLVAGAWQHVALTYDRVSGVGSLYLNGQQVAQNTLGSFTPQTSFNLVLGARTTFGSVTSPANAFPGGMDEMSLYARALSANEIEGIFAAGSAGKCTSPAPPVILGQPASQTVFANGNANLSVIAEGARTLSYQWSFDGTNIAGATNSTLTLDDVQPNQAGNYAVLVTNTYGAALSSNALLTVVIPATIHLQPLSQWALPGCSVTFFVTAKGTKPLGYQWWSGGEPLTGQTNSTFTLLDVQSNDFASYFVVVTNAYGAATSSNAVLAPEQPPVAGAVTIQRYVEGGVRVAAGQLLANSTAYDGYGLSVMAVSPNSASGGTVTLSGGEVFYLPPHRQTNSDSFAFTISDGQCGGTAVGTVTVVTKPNSLVPLNLGIQNLSGGSFLLTFDGVPSFTYQLQYTDGLENPNWQALATITADQFGVCQHADSPLTNAPARFYRATSLLGTGYTPANR